MENKSRLSQHEQFLKAISDTESTRRKGITKGPATDDSEFFKKHALFVPLIYEVFLTGTDFSQSRTKFLRTSSSCREKVTAMHADVLKTIRWSQ